MSSATPKALRPPIIDNGAIDAMVCTSFALPQHSIDFAINLVKREAVVGKRKRVSPTANQSVHANEHLSKCLFCSSFIVSGDIRRDCMASSVQSVPNISQKTFPRLFRWHNTIGLDGASEKIKPIGNLTNL